jgi:anti-sigma factor RsiW
MSERVHSEDVCRRVRERLPAFVAGELLDREGQALASHLEQCAACSAQVALQPELRQRLTGGVNAEAAPDALRERIRLSPRGGNESGVWVPLAAGTGGGRDIAGVGERRRLL